MSVIPLRNRPAKHKTEHSLPQNEKSTMKVATFETSKGKIRIELFEDKTPKTVANFEDLCKKEFY